MGSEMCIRDSRYAGLPGSANQLCRLVRFESTALTYLATIPVYAATLPIRQMMPRPLARHQHIFFASTRRFFFHNRDNDRTQFFTATKWMHQLARAYVIPVIHTIATQLVRTPSTTPPREFFSTFSLSRAFGSLADTRHCAIGSHTPSTTMSTTPPISDLTHIEGPERLTKRVTVARLEPYGDSSRGGPSGQSPARLPSHSLS